MTVSATVPTRGAEFHTVCTGCRRELDHSFMPFCPDCGAIADVEYDLAAVSLHDSSNPYHRFIDLLPVSDPGLLPTDATFTPTVQSREIGDRLGMARLFLKDETKLPTGSTKDRMAAIALPYLREHGVRTFTTSSTGNSSSAYAHAIERVPELKMLVFSAEQFRDRLSLPATEQLVDVVLRDATFVEAFDQAGHFAALHGLTSERGFFNPGRREGLKLAWLEAAEQVGSPIDWYVQAVSSAMGVYGVHRGACQLVKSGLAERVPRLLCVQQDSCAPMVSAWRAGSDRIRPQDVVARPTGIAAAILRGDPTRAYPHVHRIVRETGGTFVSVSEPQIRAAHRLAVEQERIETCFAAATALAGLIDARDSGTIGADETVLVNLTGGTRQGTPADASTVWLDRDGGGWDLSPLEASLRLDAEPSSRTNRT